MRLRSLSLMLAALLALAVAAPATAITNGTPDGTNHPYVGIIGIYTGDPGNPTPSWSCTGSLLSPTVVLTAAHCFSLFGDAVAARVWFAPELSGTPHPGTPHNGDPTSSGGIDATEWHVFTGWQVPGDPGDIGVVILSEPVDIAWLIGVPWQGRGFAGEAARAVVAWLERCGVLVITAHIHPNHRASEAVAARAGLEPTDQIDDGERVWHRVLVGIDRSV